MYRQKKNSLATMRRVTASRKDPTLRMRIRLYIGDRMLGPGKMELLGLISKTGSLSAAARKMGMSYMRAWNLVKELNFDGRRPMIVLSRGGARGGAAEITPFGRKVLKLYQEMEHRSFDAAAPYGRKLLRLFDR